MGRKRSVLYTIFPLIFLGLTLFTIGVSIWLWKDLKQERYQDLANTASILKRYYEITFHQRELSLLSVGQRLLDINGENAEERRLQFANSTLRIYNELLAFGFADTTGQLLTLTGSNVGDNLPNLTDQERSRRSFLDAKKSIGISIGEAYYFENVEDWIIPIRVPIYDDNGDLVALNTSAIQYKSMIDELMSFGIDPKYEIHIINELYNTTQLYFPLDIDRYGEVLRQPARIYSDTSMTEFQDNFKYFEAHNSISSNRILGITSNLIPLDHTITVTAPSSMIYEGFWEVERFVVLGYLFLSVVTIFAFKISRNKEQEFNQNLQSERDYSNNIINTSPVLIVGIDKNDTCTFLNPTALRTVGYDKKEIIGQNWWKLVSEDRKIDFQEVMESIQNGKIDHYEMGIQTKKGKTRIISWSSAKPYYDKGKLREVVWFGNDITEQKNAESEIIISEANLKSLFESTTSVIGLFDRNKHLIEFNSSFAHYALATDNIIAEKGMDILSMMDPQFSEMFRGFQDRALSGEKFKEIIEYPGPEGMLSFQFNYNPIYSNEEIVGVSMFVEDITELRTSQRKLEQYTKNLEDIVRDRTKKLLDTNEELQATNSELEETIVNLKNTHEQLVQAEKMASLGVLSAGVGHEINNPLNFIKNGVSGLEKELGRSNSITEDISPYISVINDGVSRAVNIVRSLSHFSRRAGSMDENCDIHDIIENCLVILHNKFKHKIEVSKDYCKEAAIIVGSEGKLHQAFLNLLSNAEQAITKKGKVLIKTIADDKMVEVEISDTGMGISQENLKKISDPFFTTKAPGEGTGLGLSITYSIIKEHNGKIKVHTELNKGTTFTVFLPLTQDNGSF